MLLPHRLSDVIPVVLQALVFDEPRAYGSIGYLIRDAACYICWSFPRAYDPHVFEPYVKEIAAMLLVVTCFDREVQVIPTFLYLRAIEFTSLLRFFFFHFFLPFSSLQIFWPI